MPDTKKELPIDLKSLNITYNIELDSFFVPDPLNKGHYITDISGIKVGFGSRYILKKVIEELLKRYPSGVISSALITSKPIPKLLTDEGVVRRQGKGYFKIEPEKNLEQKRKLEYRSLSPAVTVWEHGGTTNVLNNTQKDKELVNPIYTQNREHSMESLKINSARSFREWMNLLKERGVGLKTQRRFRNIWKKSLEQGKGEEYAARAALDILPESVLKNPTRYHGPGKSGKLSASALFIRKADETVIGEYSSAEEADKFKKEKEEKNPGKKFKIIDKDGKYSVVLEANVLDVRAEEMPSNTQDVLQYLKPLEDMVEDAHAVDIQSSKAAKIILNKFNNILSPENNITNKASIIFKKTAGLINIKKLLKQAEEDQEAPKEEANQSASQEILDSSSLPSLSPQSLAEHISGQQEDLEKTRKTLERIHQELEVLGTEAGIKQAISSVLGESVDALLTELKAKIESLGILTFIEKARKALEDLKSALGDQESIDVTPFMSMGVKDVEALKTGALPQKDEFKSVLPELTNFFKICSPVKLFKYTTQRDNRRYLNIATFEKEFNDSVKEIRSGLDYYGKVLIQKRGLEIEVSTIKKLILLWPEFLKQLEIKIEGEFKDIDRLFNEVNNLPDTIKAKHTYIEILNKKKQELEQIKQALTSKENPLGELSIGLSELVETIKKANTLLSSILKSISYLLANIGFAPLSFEDVDVMGEALAYVKRIAPPKSTILEEETLRKYLHKPTLVEEKKEGLKAKTPQELSKELEELNEYRQKLINEFKTQATSIFAGVLNLSVEQVQKNKIGSTWLENVYGQIRPIINTFGEGVNHPITKTAINTALRGLINFMVDTREAMSNSEASFNLPLFPLPSPLKDSKEIVKLADIISGNGAVSKWVNKIKPTEPLASFYSFFAGLFELLNIIDDEMVERRILLSGQTADSKTAPETK